MATRKPVARPAPAIPAELAEDPMPPAPPVRPRATAQDIAQLGIRNGMSAEDVAAILEKAGFDPS